MFVICKKSEFSAIHEALKVAYRTMCGYGFSTESIIPRFSVCQPSLIECQGLPGVVTYCYKTTQIIELDTPTAILMGALIS